ncbi:hypothetical protein NQZ68_019823 [Dissostichus eleginoides]|nr:hypothetical protein NQZ68_019823 [Dissostichus eleginoides]
MTQPAVWDEPVFLMRTSCECANALLEVNFSNIQASLAPLKETEPHGANQRHRKFPKIFPLSQISSMTPNVKRYARGPTLDLKPPATYAHPHRLLCINAHVKPGPARAN